MTFCPQILKQLSRAFIIKDFHYSNGCTKGGWNIFISTKSRYSVGFLHGSSNGLRWTKPIEHEDKCFADSLLISAATKDGWYLIIYADCSLLKNTLIDPSLSPWTQRFQAWRLAAMLLNSSIRSNYDVEARNGLEQPHIWDASVQWKQLDKGSPLFIFLAWPELWAYALFFWPSVVGSFFIFYFLDSYPCFFISFADPACGPFRLLLISFGGCSVFVCFLLGIASEIELPSPPILLKIVHFPWKCILIFPKEKKKQVPAIYTSLLLFQCPHLLFA